MAYLSDTNLLLRGIQPAHPMHQIAVAAMAKLLSRGERVCIVPQNIMEFWNVCTRPAASNVWDFRWQKRSGRWRDLKRS